ncbi:ABC transporter substrate-binding protein [Falsiroseomonas stagni]|uniref:Peptide/nickel transport system substrate-binding protein n=1 Tax=Falsiroseomonas stagni DSM 19981 TaxID=1123062 RepID=A0A1I3XYC0_9PROT|nr:ABC transporter substrate-binding protein [Falsiroseomonas stagni]SFK23996.1 peptide/nickel transport system substrate-binding protein [Falsiroseomonas stagni DSM 19981]
MNRRSVLLAATALTALPRLPALAQGAPGDAIRPLVLITRPQASAPAAYQAAELVAQEWRKLGLQIELRPLPNQQMSQVVWYERQRWDATMWQMVGRPERGDPDEMVYNLLHSANIVTGYNFVGYSNPEYDRLAEAQRSEMDQARRQQIVREVQEVVNRDQPYAFLVHPVNLQAFNKQVFVEGSAVNQAGLGIRNFWNWISLQPAGRQRDIIVNSTEPVKATNPFYVSGAPDSWVTDLVWDRLMRVGPDGLPQPWAAETVTQPDPLTIDCVIRQGMTHHDGTPVTVEDVIFSYEAPGMGDESPMYKPFVQNIASVTAVNDRTVRFVLKRPDAAFRIAVLAKLNIVSKRIWAPVVADYLNRPQNLESYVEERPIGSGPYRFVRSRVNEEVVLEANPNHWARPKADRWIMRIILNTEATLGALRRGEINVLADYFGDPDLVKTMARQLPAMIAVREEVDIGFQFIGMNLRRAPFNDAAFRRALSAAVNREMMAGAAWNGQAVPSNSMVSPALAAWHDQGIAGRVPGGNLDGARRLLQEAGYRMVGNRLHYPSGVRETTTPYQ